MWLRAPCTRGVHVDTRVNTVERRALTVRDLNINLMQVCYSATCMKTPDSRGALGVLIVCIYTGKLPKSI